MSLARLPMQGIEDFSELNVIGDSPQFRRVLELTRRLAAHDATVLVQGETGTAKAPIARAIHYLRWRKDYPFIAVNCGALPEQPGGERVRSRPRSVYRRPRLQGGLVTEAQDGTLFLEEIEVLTPKVQAASNSDLGRLVREGSFRQDLLFELQVLSIDIPPLRERTQDVILFAKTFLRCLARQYRKPPKSL